MTTWGNRLLAALSLMILMSCAAPQPKIYEQFPVVHPQLRHHLQKFEKTYNIKILKLDLLFRRGFPTQNKKTVVLGICRKNSIPLVQINSLTYSKLSSARQEALIYHELGHCIFNLNHVPHTFDDGCPMSLMYKNLVSEGCYRLYYKHYLKDLRDRQRGDRR